MRTKLIVAVIMAATIAGAAQKITNDDRSAIMALDSSGGITVGAQPIVAQMPYLLAVSMGLVDGASSVAKFGKNETTTTGDDIWAGDGVYAFYPTNAQSMEIVSANTNDTDQGTGAWTAIVQGLDADLYQIQEYVTMAGTTPVALTNTYRRVYRAVVLTCGSEPNNVGTLTVRIASAGTTAAVIPAGEGQTQQTSYTIPAGKTGYLYQTYVGLADDDKAGESCIFQIQTRLNNGHEGAWAVKGEEGCNRLGGSTWLQDIPIPGGPLPEKTDIKVIAHAASAELGTFAGYTILLIDD